MSWHYLQARGGGFSVENYLAGLLLQRLRLSHSHEKSYCSDSATDFLTNSQFGTTCELSTGDLGEGLSTSSAAVFRAKTSARPDVAQASTEKKAGCGEKCAASFAKYNRDSHSWKIPQCLPLAGLDEFLQTWPRQGMMLNGECFPRQPLELHTSATEYGFSQSIDFPTPTCRGLDGGTHARAKLQKWATPQASDWKRATQSVETCLRQQEIRRSLTLPEEVKICMHEAKQMLGGHLNPEFVEWLMGWPIGWTDSEPLAMDKFLLWQQQHSQC
jgi:hypothetical protein